MKAATKAKRTVKQCVMISIHAAREGGDDVKLALRQIRHISIHAAREGGDASANNYDEFNVIFQSTPPVKAATILTILILCRRTISIHAAREGGDFIVILLSVKVKGFQSTPPVKAATAETYKCNQHFRKQQV